MKSAVDFACIKGMVALAGFLAVVLAGIHLFSGRLRFLNVIPRSRWLSAAGGVAVAYVFVHILPDLAASEEAIRVWANRNFGFLEHHVYLLALLGLIIFYGLERLAKQSRASGVRQGEEDVTSGGVFWLHMGSFLLYNALIGYLLLHRERPGVRSMLFFFAAMGMHFLVNDYGLREDHKQRYTHVGRWMLAAAVLIGWGIGAITRIHPAVIALLFSFLAGGVILNVLKEELPEERQSNFWAFLAGSAGYAILLLSM